MKDIKTFRTTALLILLLQGSLYCAALGENSAFEKGRALYQQKQYAQAATAFAEAVRTEPRNVGAYVYEANSLYAAGKRTEAASWYKAVLQRFPDSPQCATAQTYLKAIDPAFAGTSSRAADSTPTASSKSEKPAKSSGGDTDIMSMVVVVKALGQHPHCTDDFISRVKTALAQMPHNVVAFCARKGAKIYVTPTMIDYNPDLLNSHPRGYEQGHTYKNVPAMYDGHGVVVCQFALIGEDGTEWEPTDDPIGALRHEFGHCLDHHLGRLSYSEEYRHIYYLDKGKMDADVKSQLHYYVQDGESTGGPSESFAQACCIIFGGSTSKGRQKQDQAFEPSFPGIIAFIRKKLAQVD